MPKWGIAILVVIALWLGVIVAFVLAGRRTIARELATLIPNLLVLFRGLLGDPRVRRSDKWLLALAALWIASPIDLIPEFIPVAGPLDDAIIAALVLRRLMRHAGRGVAADHWRGDPLTLDLLVRWSGAPS